MTSDVLLNIIFIGENDQDPAFVDSTPFATSLPENTDTVITGTGVVFETAISDADVIDPSGTLQTVSCSIAGNANINIGFFISVWLLFSFQFFQTLIL